MAVRFGYKASAEQFGPRELLELSVLAEDLGFDIIAVSDHFQPWRHQTGHAPAVLPWLGALGHATRNATLGTSVLTPTLRYHPSVVAQAFATLACLSPGRVFLGVGTGESMNETPATGQPWPGAKERRERLAEAIELIRELWASERVTFDGRFYQTVAATVYDRPDTPPPVYMAASGPLAAALAGRAGDGFICTSGKDPGLYQTLIAQVEAGATAGRPGPGRRAADDRGQGVLRHDCGKGTRGVSLVGGTCPHPGREGGRGGPQGNGTAGRCRRRPIPHEVHRFRRS